MQIPKLVTKWWTWAVKTDKEQPLRIEKIQNGKILQLETLCYLSMHSSTERFQQSSNWKWKICRLPAMRKKFTKSYMQKIFNNQNFILRTTQLQIWNRANQWYLNQKVNSGQTVAESSATKSSQIVAESWIHDPSIFIDLYYCYN